MVIALKKKVLLLIVVVISFVSIFELIKSKKTDEIDIQVFFVDELNDNKFETLTFCALNRYNDFDLIEVEIPEDINNIYIYVFDLYNYKRNSLPVEYKVYAPFVLDLEALNIKNDKLYLEIKPKKVDLETFHWTMYSLMITYRYLGINEVNVSFNNKTYKY